MKHIGFNIPIYDYYVDWIFIESKEDTLPISKFLDKCRILGENKLDVINTIEKEKSNGASTYRNLDIKRFCIIIYECCDEKSFYKVINHEKRHLIDRIMEHCGILDIESPACLDGYITEVLYSKGCFSYKHKEKTNEKESKAK